MGDYKFVQRVVRQNDTSPYKTLPARNEFLIKIVPTSTMVYKWCQILILCTVSIWIVGLVTLKTMGEA